MQLQDIENEVLMLLQSQGANPGGAPAWASIANSVVNQAAVDFYINRGYLHFMSDLGDLELVSFTTSFPSIVNTSAYALPPPAANVSTTLGTTVAQASTGAPFTFTPPSMTNIIVGTGLVVNYGQPDQETIFVTATPTASTATATFLKAHSSSATLTGISCPAIRMLQRVYYTPLGQSYTREEVPGVQLVSWQEFQRKTASGYLRQFSFGTEPEVCAVSPDRNSLCFYPGASTTGDTITLVYQPIPTAGTQVPLLVNATDTPFILPADTHQALAYYAGAQLAPRIREFGMRDILMASYKEEVERARRNYERSSAGQSLRFTSAAELYTGPYGFGWAAE